MGITGIQKAQIDRYLELVQDSSIQQSINNLREKRFSAKDLGISYRELNHWSTSGLLYESNEFGKMRRFNLIELVWIEILKELRKYSFSLKAIKNLRDNLELSFSLEDILAEDKDETIKEVALTALKKDLSTKDYNSFLESEFYKSLDFKTIANIFENGHLNPFQIVLIEAYYLKINHQLVINYEGFYCLNTPIYGDTISSSPYYINNFQRSHICLSMGHLIASVFRDYKPNDLNIKWKLINDDEEKVLTLIQSGKEMKSIEIKFDRQNKIELLEYTEEVELNRADFIQKAIVSGGYSEIKLLTQNGKLVVCERKIKQKINKVL